MTNNSSEYAVILEGVTYYYPGSKNPAIENVNLKVRRGEFIIIAGPSGGGKSTLCRILLGLIPHYYGGRLYGKVVVEGIDVVRSNMRELVGKVGMVFQIPENQMVNLLVEEEIAFGPENLLLPPEEINERISWALNTLRINHLRQRLTYTLSGGEAQKVALASVLALKPQILILDEPLANLDPLSAKEFLEILHSFWRENNVTVILIEHRLADAIRYAQRIIVLDKSIIAEGEPRKLVEEGVLEKHGIEIPSISKASKLLGINKVPLTINEALPVYSKLIKYNNCNPHFNIEGENNKPDPIIIVENLWYTYPSGEHALRGVNLRIHRGEFIAIVGANGAGKTTLIKHFNGLLKPTKGRVIVFGMDTRKHSIAELSRYVGIVFQNPLHQFFEETVEKEVMFTVKNMKVKNGEEKVKEILKELKIYHLRDKSPHEISAGEQRRLAIASILVYEPEVIVLDEPTAGLDYRLKHELLNIIIDKMLRKDKTVVMVSHDMEFLANAPLNRIIVMEKGKVILSGHPREVLYRVNELNLAKLTQPQIPELITSLKADKCLRPLNIDELLNILLSR